MYACMYAYVSSSTFHFASVLADAAAGAAAAAVFAAPKPTPNDP